MWPFQEGGVSLLTAALESSLDVQWKDQYECVLNPAAPPISLDASQRIIEILKILFNITHHAHRQEPSEVSDMMTYAASMTECVINPSAFRRYQCIYKRAHEIKSRPPVSQRHFTHRHREMSFNQVVRTFSPPSG